LKSAEHTKKPSASTDAAPAKPKSQRKDAAAKSVPPAEPSHVLHAPVTITKPLALHKDVMNTLRWKGKMIAELSDADILAMPESEYMDDVQFAFFKLKLLHLKQEILSSAGETTEHLREDTAVMPDPTDRATVEEEHALELLTRDRERKLLKKIDIALARIEAGEYGYCDETGEPIGLGRLLARPTATLSLEAQQRREMRQKMFGE
jgi:DnaK suppressor protein